MVYKRTDKIVYVQGLMCVGMCVLCVPQSAVGYEYQAELSKHGSQTDAAKGFGGKFGVQKDRQDQSAGGYDDMQDSSLNQKN